MKNLLIALLAATIFGCSCNNGPKGTWRITPEIRSWYPFEQGDTISFIGADGEISRLVVGYARITTFEGLSSDEYEAYERFDAEAVRIHPRQSPYTIGKYKGSVSFEQGGYYEENYGVEYTPQYGIVTPDNIHLHSFANIVDQEFGYYLLDTMTVNDSLLENVYFHDLTVYEGVNPQTWRDAEVTKSYCAQGYGIVRLEFYDGYWVERLWE